MFLRYFILIFSAFIIKNTAVANDNFGAMSGRVIDSLTSAPLEGATVSIPDLKVSTTTNKDGQYHFNYLPGGRFTVQVSYVGYKSKVTQVYIGQNNTINFSLLASVVEYENVTVTGVSSATDLKRTPSQVSIISKKEIQSAAGINLLDVVARQPGVAIVTTGPAIAKPFIRGLGYNRVVTINDGVRQEGQQWGDEHGLEVDEYSTQKIEVLRGPASLMYGSDAIGGVINVLTNIPVANNTLHATVMNGYNSNNNMFGHNVNIAGNSNGFNFNAYGSIKNAGDYKNRFDGRVLNSRFGEKNFGGYIGLNKNWGYSHILFSRYDQRLGMIEGERDEKGAFVIDGHEIMGNSLNSKTPLEPYQHILHTKLALDNSFSLQNGGRLTLLLGLQRNQRREFGHNHEDEHEHDHDHDHEEGDHDHDHDHEHEEAATGLPSAYFDLKTFNYSTAYHLPYINNWKTSIGVNGMYQTNTNKGEEALIPDYSIFDFGIYAYTSKTINRTTLSGGLRYDARNMQGQSLFEHDAQKFEAFTRKFSNISGSVGFNQELSQQVSLKGNISRGFRAPNASELAANGSHEGTNRYETGDQNLRSEISTSVDFGMQLSTDHFDFEVAPFYNHIQNFIFSRKVLNNAGQDSLLDGANVYRFAQQTAGLTGIEARFDLHPHPLDWLHFENTFSWVRGRFANDVDGSNNLPFIAPASILTELRGEFAKAGNVFKNLYIKFEVNAVAAQNQFFAGYNTETATKGYTLLNAGAGTDVAIAGKRRASIVFGVNNIADIAYQSHLSMLKYTAQNPATGRMGVFNMGRNFTVRLIVPFEWKLQ